MKAAIIVFPGTNRDRDMKQALEKAGFKTSYVFSKETELPKVDLVVLPGGFSYGDYLRTGAMAAKAPIISEVIRFANNGGLTLGICNGFQILCETGLLPGVLMPNEGGMFICKTVSLKIQSDQYCFTKNYKKGDIINIPVAHGEGNYFASQEDLQQIEDDNLVILRYLDNINGSQDNIAGIVNKSGNVAGMMPHPENHIDNIHENKDGLKLFTSILNSAISA